MARRRELFPSHRTMVIALAMAGVFAVSIGLAFAMSSRPARYAFGGAATSYRRVDLGVAKVPVPDAWQRQALDARGLPMREVSLWSDPERPSRRLLTARLEPGRPVADPGVVLDEVYVALLEHPAFEGRPRSGGMGFRSQTPKTRAASYFLALRDAQGNFMQNLLTLAVPAGGASTDLVVLFLDDEGDATDRTVMQANQLFMRSIVQQIGWRGDPGS